MRIFGLGVDGSIFHQMLNPGARIDTAQVSNAGNVGWYILLRTLTPYLQRGNGVSLGKVDVCEKAVAAKFKVTENPAICLAHERIHAPHYKCGEGYWNAAIEESRTVGLYPYQSERFTENAFRRAFAGTGFQGMKSGWRRDKY